MDTRRVGQFIFFVGIGLMAVTAVVLFRRNRRSAGSHESTVEHDNLSASVEGKVDERKIRQALDALTSINEDTDKLVQNLREKLDTLIGQIRTTSNSRDR